jgi:nitrate/nitrite transporter NarK
MQFLAILIVAALFVKYFWLLVVAIAAAYLSYHVIKEWRLARVEAQAAAAAEAQRRDDIRARADQQHAWAMQGDPRGMFGEYPPAATDHINSLPPIRSFWVCS